MPKLIDPNTGRTVYATAAAAAVLHGRGYTDANKTPTAPREAAGWPDSHAALDQLADTLGFTWPDPPAGKKKLTLAEKTLALEAAGHSSANLNDEDE